MCKQAYHRKDDFKMDFSSAVFFKNVREIAKRRNMKIGELEQAADVSPGYISRTEKSSSNPSMAFVVNVAGVLNCSIDLLLEEKLPYFTDIDFVVHDFMRKLQAETSAGKLEWTMAAGVCSAAFIGSKTLFVSGAPVKGAWQKIKIWAEDAMTPDAPVEPATDEAGDSETTEKPEVEKHQYVMYDETVDKNPELYHMARETIMLVKAYAESQVKPDALAIMKEYLTVLSGLHPTVETVG